VTPVRTSGRWWLRSRFWLAIIAVIGIAAALVDVTGLVEGVTRPGLTQLAQPAQSRPGAAVAASSAPAACGYAAARPLAELKSRAVPEASGLAASRQVPDVYWTLNDHSNSAMLVALDAQGRSRGVVSVTNADNTDWEALQPGPGRDGSPALYIGDIGDNDEGRRDVTIYRVPEPLLPPAPASGEPPVLSTPPPEVFKLVYPDGPHNAEAMLVHPTTGELVVITKEKSGQSSVFRAPNPLDASQVGTFERVGGLDVSALGGPGAGASGKSAASGKLVTDAAISPDGQRVAVRTYTAALEYDLAQGASLASIWSQAPRVSPLDDGKKGEGITYKMDSHALVTIGEGKSQALHELRRSC
jgi:hypothetical protein